MKFFFEVFSALLLIVLIAVAIVCVIANNNGITFAEQIRNWLGIISDNPPIVNPSKKIGF